VRKAVIEEENRRQIARQREFRIAADLITEGWSQFTEIVSIAITGSVAKPLWKEVPRFTSFRARRIELWHECTDVDLVVWVESQHRLGELRRAQDRTLRKAFESGAGISVAGHQVDSFLIEPVTNRYLGRLCHFGQCPKGKRDCLVPGCGVIAFNKVIKDFSPDEDLLGSAVVLYRRGSGIISRAVDLPSVPET
jgi:hypothetical protein